MGFLTTIEWRVDGTASSLLPRHFVDRKKRMMRSRYRTWHKFLRKSSSIKFDVFIAFAQSIRYSLFTTSTQASQTTDHAMIVHQSSVQNRIEALPTKNCRTTTWRCVVAVDVADSRHPVDAQADYGGYWLSLCIDRLSSVRVSAIRAYAIDSKVEFEHFEGELWCNKVHTWSDCDNSTTIWLLQMRQTLPFVNWELSIYSNEKSVAVWVNIAINDGIHRSKGLKNPKRCRRKRRRNSTRLPLCMWQTVSHFIVDKWECGCRRHSNYDQTGWNVFLMRCNLVWRVSRQFR